jgi:2-methylisocitrate lyase-like PEP mutase family enzyme
MILPDSIPYDRALAVERIRAAAAAARALPSDFYLLARADGLMNNVYDMKEALLRCRGFEEAGADGLYVPMPPSMDALRGLCASTSLPVNALAAGPYAKVSRDDFATAGVARISLGSALARRVTRTLFDVGQSILTDGDFSDLTEGATFQQIEQALEKGSS